MMLKSYTIYERMSKLKAKAIALMVMLMISSFVFAQTQRISGTVSDSETGDPIPGVNILVKGTTTGTVTDIDGNYQINASSSDVLVFSAIGYITEEIAVGSQTTINLQFQADVTALEEIVVTGYTTQRKQDITGAVSVVDVDDMNAIKTPSFAQKLAGRASGVNITTSGQPGDGTNIRIRGISSFAGSDPLVVIDGIQIQGDKALTGLNPNDIESIQILKDAAAASIYGARASAGVIIVTTKQGSKGQMKISYDGYAGSQTPVGGYDDILSTDPLQFARYHVIANPSTIDFYGGDAGNPMIPNIYFAPEGWGGDLNDYNYPNNPTQAPYQIMESNQAGTDWWNEVFGPALIMDHNLNLSGGSENAVYNASVGYFKQDGTMNHISFDRFSARLNSRINMGKFTFGESVSLARSIRKGQAGTNGSEQNVMTQILKMNSIVPVYDIAGNFAGAKTGGFTNGSNPVARLYRDRQDENIENRILGNFYLEFEIIDGLKAKTSYSLDASQGLGTNFSFPTWENREVNQTNFFSEGHSNGFNWVWTNTLTYSKNINDRHVFTVLAGYEALENRRREINARVDNFDFTSTDIRYINTALATFNNVSSSLPTWSTFASIFGKVDYALDDKYLLSATVRRDGSSNFGQEKYGVFPAFSLGWRISEEAFMDGISWLDDLKLRGGWGITGNANTPSYNAFNQWGSRSPFDASYDITGSNTGLTPGFAQTNIGNALTSWEENVTMNFGFDATLFDGKLTAVLDIYTKEINGLLFQAPFPGTAGNAVVPAANVAEMVNNGFDLSLNYSNFITSDIKLNIGTNISRYTNEIIALDGNALTVFPGGVDKRFGEINALPVGYPISSFWGLQLDGIFQTDAEVAALDQPGAAVGRYRFKDLNEDGQINDDDKGVIGNPHPDLTVGLNLGLEYKQWDFNMFLFGSFGNDIYNYNRLFTHFGFFNSNISTERLENSWTPETPNAEFPAFDGDDSFSLESSTFYVEKGGYVRAQNISIGYTFPANDVFSNLRVYVQGQNLFTITNYGGIDPALSNVNIGDGNQNDIWTGFDFGNFPSSRIISVGVNASF